MYQEVVGHDKKIVEGNTNSISCPNYLFLGRRMRPMPGKSDIRTENNSEFSEIVLINFFRGYTLLTLFHMSSGRYVIT